MGPPLVYIFDPHDSNQESSDSTGQYAYKGGEQEGRVR